jgi:hypothetical protein
MPKRVSLKGKGADLFFGDYPTATETDAIPSSVQTLDEADSATAAAADASAPPVSLSQTELNGEHPAPPPNAEAPRRRPSPDTRTASLSSQRASVLASVDASTVEAIRQVIKSPGREVSFVRLTPEEKANLADIVYTYKRQGQKTSETEINRIAINYLLLDFREHGEQSVLARVLAALHA